MPRKTLSALALLTALCFLLPARAGAQTADRAQAAAEIESLRDQIKARESILLATAPGVDTPWRSRRVECQLPAMRVAVRLVVLALGDVHFVVAEMPAEDVHRPIDVERLGDGVGDERAVVRGELK